MLGVALILACPGGHHPDAAVHLLAALGISTLFLYAGLEVDLETLRRRAGAAVRLSIDTHAVDGHVAWLGWRYLDLRWQDATLLALALLTSSTGFIIDSLDRYGLATEERFWVTNNAISAELLALAIMFVVLKANDPGELAGPRSRCRPRWSHCRSHSSRWDAGSFRTPRARRFRC